MLQRITLAKWLISVSSFMAGSTLNGAAKELLIGSGIGCDLQGG